MIAVADIVISVARAASTALVALPVDASGSVRMDRTWFVGDSGLFQCGVRALPTVQAVVSETGLMNSLLGTEHRAKSACGLASGGEMECSCARLTAVASSRAKLG